MFKQITIQFTSHCNLNCPYCFADHHTISNITPSDFAYFYDFCKKNHLDNIHITGGEPFLHNEASQYIADLNKISDIVVYSNFTIPDIMHGIYPVKNELHFLVNINDLETYTSSQWAHLNQNIEDALSRHVRITLSKTFYKKPYDLKTVFALSTKFNIRRLRMSHSIPHSAIQNTSLSENEIQHLYNYIYSLKKEMYSHQITRFYFDCPIKPCLLDAQFYQKLLKENIIGSSCLPKVVLSTDLNVYHCYIQPNKPSHVLQDFRNFEDLHQSISNQLRENALFANRSDSCKVCSHHISETLCGCPYS